MHSGSIQPVQWWRLWDPIQPVASPQYNIIEQSPNWHIVSKDNLHYLMELWMVDMLALLYKANVSRLATALQWRELWWVWKGCQPEHAIEVVRTRQGTFYMEQQANRNGRGSGSESSWLAEVHHVLRAFSVVDRAEMGTWWMGWNSKLSFIVWVSIQNGDSWVGIECIGCIKR